MNDNPPILHRGNGLVSQGAHGNKPLLRNIGFNHGVAAITAANGVIMHLFLDEIVFFFQIFYNSCAAGKTVKAGIRSGILIHNAAVIHNFQLHKTVAQTHFIVITVMGRGHFQGTGAKLPLHTGVTDDGNIAINQGQ